MDATTESTTVERTISIAATPQTVWEFFVDPEKLVRWMCTNAELDTNPGGIYRNEVIRRHIARGEFVELDPPHRLVFPFGSEKTGEDEPAVAPGRPTIQ